MPANAPGNHTKLFEELAAGSQAALQQVEMLYKNMLLQRIEQLVHNPELSKEILADTLHALWINRKEVVEKFNVVGWMIVTARNKAINAIRDEKQKETVSLEQFPFLETAEKIEAELEAKELEKMIELAVEKLAPREKLVFTLSRKRGLNRKEIAERFNVSENTVRNQLHNALVNIRKHLSKMMRSIFV